ncbi:PA domain-containing protein [Massilia yuzhufengensis]|uniref:PA domain-containing protein n=1 Tax=Massilia yuzhufengensis TaxID=1164594 RepID=A0A1I1F1H0_9BURK|nr:PA domain-containing protein [Massilia yuzhufengensis]SFB91030.1 PA domain-containing protein [Massilia yuzhufengensis]
MKAAKSLCRMAAALACALAGAGAAQAAATITIVNQNAPGIGFNDPTPATPVGGNTGTTLGQQRLIAFQQAASIWGATLTSAVPIRIGAAFVPLACNTTGAVLGSAGAAEVWSDFPNAPRANTWYPAALAAKLAGVDLTAPATPHIVARFNSRLGLFPDCVPGLTFYLGLDNNAPASQIDLVTTLLHEMGHGLGFQTFTDDETGQQFFGIPSVWDYHLVDNRTNTPWVAMTDAQRQASAITWRGLSWDGPNVNAAVPTVLAPRSNLNIGGANAGGAAGNYFVGTASFGPALGTTPVGGQLMPVVDQANGTGLACTPLGANNALAVRNNVALVDRGSCDFTVKARNVQAAGALAMVVVDNVAGEVAGLPGTDPAVTIPSVRITLADGNTIKATLQQRSRTKSGVVATLAADSTQLAGADAQRRILMYTPSVNSPGSSVSHYTTEATPNQLMEPSINDDLGHTVTPPRDLTFPLLRDIGW